MRDEIEQAKAGILFSKLAKFSQQHFIGKSTLLLHLRSRQYAMMPSLRDSRLRNVVNRNLSAISKRAISGKRMRSALWGQQLNTGNHRCRPGGLDYFHFRLCRQTSSTVQLPGTTESDPESETEYPVQCQSIPAVLCKAGKGSHSNDTRW